jgi:hypothetical protein
MRRKEVRLIALLEALTGVTAPKLNKFAVLLAELVRQRNAANAEVIATRRALRRRNRDVAELKRRLREAQSFHGKLTIESEDTDR